MGASASFKTKVSQKAQTTFKKQRSQHIRSSSLRGAVRGAEQATTEESARCKGTLGTESKLLLTEKLPLC